jgi:polyphosphate kinase 2
MKKIDYEQHLIRLQTELVQLQEWVKQQNKKVVVLFEGRDAAGKGGAIKAITARLNPRVVRIAALSKPSEQEQSQWYFQRYVAQLPAAGEIVLFDRSWYNRAGVEKVMGFCSQQQHQDFLQACPSFEKLLLDAGIILIKYWFSVSDQEQEKRFLERINNPLKRWKFSAMDLLSRSRWQAYSQAKDQMFKHTDTQQSPWFVVDAEDKRAARLNCICHLLSQIPYQAVVSEQISLPKIDTQNMLRPPFQEQRFIPNKYA